eukprot:10082133-Alexandrium_andersonii.AAC.1
MQFRSAGPRPILHSRSQDPIRIELPGLSFSNGVSAALSAGQRGPRLVAMGVEGEASEPSPSISIARPELSDRHG